MQFNNMKITKDWWDAMRDTPETKLNETTTTIQVDYKDPKDIYREILIRELIKAGNYQTPDGLIDMMVKGLYSGKIQIFYRGTRDILKHIVTTTENKLLT